MISRWVIIPLFVLSILGLGACSSDSCSSIEVGKYLVEVRHLYSQWETTADSMRLITSTSFFDELEELRDEVERISTPGCAKKSKSILIEYMDMYLDGSYAFMAADEELGIELLLKAYEKKDEYEHELTLIETEKSPTAVLPTSTPITDFAIRYILKGTAEEVEADYIDDEGVVKIRLIELSWSQDFFDFQLGDTVHLSADNPDDTGWIQCEIWLNDTRIFLDTASSPESRAECIGNIYQP